MVSYTVIPIVVPVLSVHNGFFPHPLGQLLDVCFVCFKAGMQAF